MDFNLNFDLYNYLLFLILIIFVGYYSIKYLFFIIIGFLLGVYITYYYLK